MIIFILFKIINIKIYFYLINEIILLNKNIKIFYNKNTNSIKNIYNFSNL